MRIWDLITGADVARDTPRRERRTGRVRRSQRTVKIKREPPPRRKK